MTQLRLPERAGTVLFDLDGTILDSSVVVLAAWEEALGSMGLPRLERDELHKVIGPPTDHSAPLVLAERGVERDGAVAELLEVFEPAVQRTEVEQAVAYDGIADVVRELQADGRRLAVVTSKPYESAEVVLPALGIHELFVHLEAPRRGDAEVKDVTMGRAVAALGLDPADTVLVGDRHHDVDAGRAHGIATVGVTWGGFTSREELDGAGAVAVVDTPAELRPLLGL